MQKIKKFTNLIFGLKYKKSFRILFISILFFPFLSSGQVINNSSGSSLDSTFVNYFENGKPNRIQLFYKGLLNGPSWEFHPSGQLMFYNQWAKGRKDGIQIIYNQAGKKIKSSNILGHSDIAPLRKEDPGEKFPWHFLSKKKIGYWHNISKKNIKNQNLSKSNLRKLFFNNLYKIGYRYFDKKKSSKNYLKVIKAFQRRFRQNKVTGLIDQESFQISHYLATSLKY